MAYYSGFQRNGFQRNAFQINGGVPVTETSGGIVEDTQEYYQPIVRREIELRSDIIKVETTLIDLRQRAQEARLKELQLKKQLELIDEQAMTRLLAMQQFLQEQIYLQTQALLLLQNDLALLVLMMASPLSFMGGVRTIM